jgi:hypothetical protein
MRNNQILEITEEDPTVRWSILSFYLKKTKSQREQQALAELQEHTEAVYMPSDIYDIYYGHD